MPDNPRRRPRAWQPTGNADAVISTASDASDGHRARSPCNARIASGHSCTQARARPRAQRALARRPRRASAPAPRASEFFSIFPRIFLIFLRRAPPRQPHATRAKGGRSAARIDSASSPRVFRVGARAPAWNFPGRRAKKIFAIFSRKNLHFSHQAARGPRRMRRA
jgi:hypothetical protein